MNQSAHDDFARMPVDEAHLRPWWYLLIIETWVLISIPLFVIGGQLGHGLSLADLLLATISGAAILGVIGALTASINGKIRSAHALLDSLDCARHFWQQRRDSNWSYPGV